MNDLPFAALAKKGGRVDFEVRQVLVEGARLIAGLWVWRSFILANSHSQQTSRKHCIRSTSIMIDWNTCNVTVQTAFKLAVSETFQSEIAVSH